MTEADTQTEQRPIYPTGNEWRHWSRSQRLEFALEVLVDAVEHDHNRVQHSERIRTATHTAHLALEDEPG